MGTEVERKFLVDGDGWRDGASGPELVVQHYLTTGDPEVRVRVSGGQAWLTVKTGAGVSRGEFEYRIPVVDADEIAESCQWRITKLRRSVMHAGRRWDVDEYQGPHAGLVVAEVEVDDPDDVVEVPDWAGREVTGEPGWSNAELATRP